MHKIQKYERTKIVTPTGGELVCAVARTPDGPVAYLEPNRTLEALRYPKGILASAAAALANAANALTIQDSTGAWRAQINGVEVFRPQVFLKALQAAYHANYMKVWPDGETRRRPIPGMEEMAEFLLRYDALQMWFMRAGELALINVVEPQSDAKDIIPSDPMGIVKAIAQGLVSVESRVSYIEEKQKDQEQALKRIANNPTPSTRNPEAFITVSDGCAELGFNPSRLDSMSGHNLEQKAGVQLKRMADAGTIEKGDPQPLQLSGCSVRTEVNTYHRKDVYAMLRKLNPGQS